ncbi:MAG TPA: VVA0879 family protein [Fimbriimonadaceae bacterium]|nr:VVA0879 family protein [Fimbriimonadaceae bacterium]
MKQPVRMTVDEWLAEGKRRFGGDPGEWAFVCPICKGVQTVNDFRPFKDKGATPDTARFSCLGRFLPNTASAFFGHPDNQSRCDYTLGGLIPLPGVIVTDYDGKELLCFAFAEPTEALART